MPLYDVLTDLGARSGNLAIRVSRFGCPLVCGFAYCGAVQTLPLATVCCDMTGAPLNVRHAVTTHVAFPFTGTYPQQCKEFRCWYWLSLCSTSVASFFLSWKHSKRSSMLIVWWFLTVFTIILRYHPGRRILISSSHLNALLPKIWGTTLGVNHLFVEKHKCELPWFSFLPMLRWRACSMESFRISWLGHLCIGEFDGTNIIDTLLRLEFSR